MIKRVSKFLSLFIPSRLKEKQEKERNLISQSAVFQIPELTDL